MNCAYMVVRTMEGPSSDEPVRVVEIVVRGSKMAFLACATVIVKMHGYLSRIDGWAGIRAVKIETQPASPWGVDTLKEKHLMSALKLHKPKFTVGDKEYCIWKAGDQFIKTVAMTDNPFFRTSAYECDAQGYAITGLLLGVSGPGKHRRCALNAIQQL